MLGNLIEEKDWAQDRRNSQRGKRKKQETGVMETTREKFLDDGGLVRQCF